MSDGTAGEGTTMVREASVLALPARTAPRIVPIPLAPVRLLAALMARLLSNPPITPAMLGVLQHDDRIDTAVACERLGLELTPLYDTLAHCLRETQETR